MRRICFYASLLILFSRPAFGQLPPDEPLPPVPPREPTPAPTPAPTAKADYSHFSKLMQKMVAPHVPKFYEDLSGWGGSIPVPPDLKLPRLRTYIKVGDRVEVPHGIWKKFRIWIDEPERDVEVRLLDMKRTDKGGFRLQIEGTALLHGEGEVKPWQKGLGLPIVKADADIVVQLNLEVDVKLTFDTKTFPPEISVEPWIVSSNLQIRDFHLKRIQSLITIEGDTVSNLGNEIKGLLNDLIRRYDEEVTDRANQAIAASLKSGRGTLSTGELMKMFLSK